MAVAFIGLAASLFLCGGCSWYSAKHAPRRAYFDTFGGIVLPPVEAR